MIIRRELPSDTEAIQALFSNVSSEVFFDKLHTDSSWLPALSFVVIDRDDDVVGHVAATRGQVGSAHALALVPPSVDPEERDRGVGQALMHAVLGAADALDESLVGLVAIPPRVLLPVRLPPGRGIRHHSSGGRMAALLPHAPPHRLQRRHAWHIHVPRSLPVTADGGP